MDNSITGKPNYWNRLRKSAKQQGVHRAVGYWSGLIAGQQFVKRTAFISLGLGIVIGFFIKS